MHQHYIKIKKLLIILLLFLSTYSLFPSGSTLQGGAIQRNPALGLNFLGGIRLDYLLEIECDFRLGSKISLAPRLGLSHVEWISPGISIRFGIFEGHRPHGFWIGPAADFIFASKNNKWSNESQLMIALSGEFGYKYTFSFGFYLQGLTRLGFVIAEEGSGFFWNIGIGLGYAF